MGDYEKFLSRREEEILKTLGYDNEKSYRAHERLTTTKGTCLSESGLRSSMTRVFQRYMEALEVMADFYPVFHRRFNKHEEELKRLQRQINKRRREEKK